MNFMGEEITELDIYKINNDINRAFSLVVRFSLGEERSAVNSRNDSLFSSSVRKNREILVYSS